MALTLNGSTGITSANIADGTITNADVNDVAASKLTGALPAIDGSALTGMPASGKVLQVVQNTYSTLASVGGSSYTDTGLSATITPSSTSSKVLVLVHQPMTHLVDTNSDRLNITRLVRGSTEVLSSRTLTQHEGSTNRAYDSTYMGHTYLDSPSTTSATTYKTQFYIDGTSSDLYAQWGGGTSTMILLEIAG